MPILDITPGQSPEAPGTLAFFRQGADPSTGVQLTTEGQVIAPGGTQVTGDQTVSGNLTVTGALDVTGYTSLAAGQFDGQLTLWSGEPQTLRLGTAGGGISIAEGADACLGAAVLTAGTVTVATDKVTATSRIQLTAQDAGAAPGALYVSAREPGTSFTISSTSGTDTSLVAWQITEPAA